MKKAVCVLKSVDNNKLKGYVIFEEKNKITEIKYKIINIPNGKHGFHIHEKGNLMEGCKSLCSHFNPYKKEHGDLNDNNSHVGDLGNIIVENNKSENIIKSKYMLLTGDTNVLGRSVVVHEKEDDLGKGKNKDSKKTGNAGSRICCGIIGHF